VNLLKTILAVGVGLGAVALAAVAPATKPTAATKPANVHATLVKVDGMNLLVKVTGQAGKETAVPTDDKTKFLIDYEDGKLADLTSGMTLTITQPGATATLIRAHVKGRYGVVVKMDGNNLVMTAKTKEVTVPTDDKTRVVLDGKPAKLSDLKAGMNVKAIPETGAATKIAVVPSAVTKPAAEAKFRDKFPVDKTNLLDKGRNTYFILEPGCRLTYQDGKDTLTITVLDETKTVDGVKTRIVEERETKNGKLSEVSRNYFAIDKATNDVYYFGEDVDDYDADGKVTGHGGSWLSGVGGAKFGLMMPGKPKVGNRYYQELAPKVAMDRGEVLSLTEEVKVPAGTFKNCIKIRDSSALESGAEDKLYAPDVGLLKDGGFELTKIEKPKQADAPGK
jgi:hypothetical protein